MSFHLEIAAPDDAERITQIHMDAFGSNAIIRAIHAGNDKDLKELRSAVKDKLLADIRDSKITVLIVRVLDSSVTGERTNANELISREKLRGASGGSERGNIVGFAKWIHPYCPQDNYITAPWSTPSSADWKILRPWLDQVTKVEEEIIGQTSRYGS